MYFDGMNMFGNGMHRPKLGDGPVKDFRPVESWWRQPVIILDRHPYTRSEIVLNVADKDGGAHVDATLTPEYENLITAGSLGELVELTDEGVRVTPIPDAHFSALRQIGFELLNSEHLLKLVGHD